MILNLWLLAMQSIAFWMRFLMMFGCFIYLQTLSMLLRWHWTVRSQGDHGKEAEEHKEVEGEGEGETDEGVERGDTMHLSTERA